MAHMAELKLTLEIPELEALMADVQQVLDDVRSLKTEVGSRLDAIDNVIEALRAQVQSGQVDQTTIDQIASEVSSARQSLAAVSPDDPSGDDAAATPTQDPAPGGGSAPADTPPAA